MQERTGKGALLAALALFVIAAASATAAAQDSDAPRQQQQQRADMNHEVQLHVLVNAADAGAGARVPAALEPVVRQLKAALPPSDYRLAASFINRVRDGGSFDLKTVGAPFGPPQTPSQLPPTFFEIGLNSVKLIDPAAAQPSINIQQFRLGMRVPIQTGAVGEKGASPIIQYEGTGLSTQLSVREGEPTLVGTLNATRPGELYIIVVTVKRTK